MNINPEYEERDSIELVMAEAMQYLLDTLIVPQKDNLTQEQTSTIATIGIIFKDIAERAEAYTKMKEDGLGQNSFSRN